MIAGSNFRFEIFKICSWLICKFSSAAERRKDDWSGRAPVERSCPGRRVGEPAVFRAGSPDGGRRSGVLQPNGIANHLPKLLLEPEIALRCLDRCAAEEELDLLQLAAREMA